MHPAVLLYVRSPDGVVTSAEHIVLIPPPN